MNRPLLFGADIDTTLKQVENYSVEDLRKVDLAEARDHRKTTLTLAIVSTVFAGLGFFVMFSGKK